MAATPPASRRSRRGTSRGCAGAGGACSVANFRTFSSFAEPIVGEARELSAVGRNCAHAGSGEHALKITHYDVHRAIAVSTATAREQRERWAGPPAGAPYERTVRRMVSCRSAGAPSHCERAQPAAHMGGDGACARRHGKEHMLAFFLAFPRFWSASRASERKLVQTADRVDRRPPATGGMGSGRRMPMRGHRLAVL